MISHLDVSLSTQDLMMSVLQELADRNYISTRDVRYPP